MTGVTLRWLVAAGPTDDTRILTVRVRTCALSISVGPT